MGRNLWETC